MGVFEAIGKGIGLVAKNPKLFLLMIVISVVLILAGIPLLIAIFGPATMQAGGGAALTAEQLSKINWGLFILFILVSTIAQIFVNSGLVGLIKDMVKTGGCKLGNMLGHAKKYFLNFLLFAVIMMLVVAVIVLIIAILGIIAGAIGSKIAAIGVILGIIAGIIALAALVLMGIYGSFGPVVIVSEDKKALEAIKSIAGFLKGKMWKSIGLGTSYWAILILITVVNNLIVGAGGAMAVVVQIISGLLNMYISLAYIASFMYFYNGNSVKKI